MGIDPGTHKPKVDAFGSGSGVLKDAAHLSHMAQWESARLEAEARMVRESKLASNQLGFPSPHQLFTTTTAAAAAVPPVRPKCLDVLKAWQGIVSGKFFVSSDSLESPTSTLNFSAVNSVVEFHQQSSVAIPPPQFPVCNITCKGEMGEHASNQMAPQVKEALDGSISVHGMSAYTTENAWALDSFEAAAKENASIGNIAEGLSAIVPYNCGEQNASMPGEKTATSESCGGGGNLEDLQGDYWNSLFIFPDS